MIKVKNIMTKDVITISKDSSIMEAAKLLISKSVSSLVVVEMSETQSVSEHTQKPKVFAENKPIAVVSENDIIKGIIFKKTKVRDAMDKEFTIISPLTKFSDISKSLKEKKIKRFPVVENDKLVGLITETDVIEATRDFTRFHQIVQEVILAIFGLATAFFLFYFSPIGISVFG